MVPVQPITVCEFIPMLRRCKPPTGWPRKLAIANSGGPDSTCLSFLLNQALHETERRDLNTGAWFKELLSLNVDHQFQSCSSKMSLKASKTSHRIGIPHKTLKIPWGSSPYPVKPSARQPLERIARDARYTLLLSGMRQHEADVIAFGHHADDQLETFLMRLASGSGFLGLGGMKPIRRFGMGDGSPGKIGWYGAEGMKRWIIRPLLGVSKSRVLATCEAHGLDYVTDETNFQPDITLRNEVRHALAAGDTSKDKRRDRTFRRITASAKHLGIPLTLPNRIEVLRESADHYSLEVGRIEAEASAFLRDYTLPSPSSTVLIPQNKLSKVKDPLVQRSIVIQVLRFVSPHPWGSRAAEGFRQLTRLKRIASAIFSDYPRGSAFSAGSHVLWSPVYVGPRGQIKYTKSISAADGWTAAWLASCSPPYSNTGGASGLEIDVTSLIVDKQATADPIEILYDNRFLLSFYPRAIPAEVLERLRAHPPPGQRLVVTSTKRHIQPILAFRRSNEDAVKDAATDHDVLSMSNTHGNSGKFIGADWVDWRSIRSFE